MTKAIPSFVLICMAVAVPSSPVGQSQSQPNRPLEYAAGRKGEANSGWPATAVRASKAMVVSDEKLASDAGVEIMKRGGNAVDAAVAVAFALAVVEPEAGNIGGGGFMLIRTAAGKAEFVDYRETAPAKATRDMYLRPDGSVDPQASIRGYRAVGVPGTVAGLTLALRKFGTMKLPDVMAPAIRLAEEGFPMSDWLAGLLRNPRSSLDQFAMSRRVFLKDGEYYKPGEIFKQPQLAATLRRIAKRGASEFYHGTTAHNLAKEMKEEGGLITLDDLAHYRAKIREPLTKTYSLNGHNWQIITSPPPSSGGIATIEALNILQTVPLKSWDDPESVHWVVETMRRVFADRAMYLADPDFASVPVNPLTSGCYADSLRATIDPTRASSSEQVAVEDPKILQKDSALPCAGPGSGKVVADKDAAAIALAEATHDGHTTHFSVVDGAGNAVANTYTLNSYFGSGVTSADGFLLNDEMDDFTTHPGSANMFGLVQSEANTVGPGKRPLSSMMPTILLRDDKLSFVTGSPGGPTIISVTLLSVLNWMRLGMDAQAAINSPRFHQQWMPEEVALEPSISQAVVEALESRGYHIARNRPWLGKIEAIGIDPENGDRLGAADPRRSGAASGY
ncbi:MAG TPA: gamma-glutamyltransferase [Candidatus Acidoferrum sp.]|nr:gamma-glutamyltransferase [Candidatus Acidoferrum sp.]